MLPEMVAFEQVDPHDLKDTLGEPQLSKNEVARPFEALQTIKLRTFKGGVLGRSATTHISLKHAVDSENVVTPVGAENGSNISPSNPTNIIHLHITSAFFFLPRSHTVPLCK